MRLALTFVLAVACLRGDTLKEILDRMDAESVKFHAVKADLKHVVYGSVFKEETVSTGVLTLVKEKKGIAALVEFLTPDPKQYLFRDNQVQEFLPKLNLINDMDMGKASGAINQFVTLAFGASGKDLQKSYHVAMKGAETLKIGDKEVKVTRLVLVPKSAEALELVKKIELWVPEGKSYSVQLKAFQKSGDTNSEIYSNLEMNPPALLTGHPIELKAPKNAKHEKINK